MQLLLIEDDQQLSEALEYALRDKGYSVNSVASGGQGLAAISAGTADLIILDLGLPDMDGIEVLKSIRNQGLDTPTLVLTARSETESKVIGLDSGADDYLSKPFEMSELLARLRVFERRAHHQTSAVMQAHNVTFNLNSLDVSVGGEAVQLSRKELMVLRALMDNKGRVVTKNKLEEKLYSWGEEIASNAVEVHIHHLRKKLGSQLISTVRGLGYRIPKE